MKTKLPAKDQAALFYRLAREDTVSSSRIKSSPSRPHLTPYEKARKVEELCRKKGNAENEASVYDRLSAQGTKSSLRKLQLGQQRYSGHETLAEGCSTGLLRKFEGSTFVPFKAPAKVRSPGVGTVISFKRR
mmetsp:Transcript_13123/g.19129  ORF Transcript_13123/g.19129 Transcript_13123/m.19129 type:complete len:132 (+) Transcript_13123:1-396(+)